MSHHLEKKKRKENESKKEKEKDTVGAMWCALLKERRAKV
jgi:hypothetical protein